MNKKNKILIYSVMIIIVIMVGYVLINEGINSYTQFNKDAENCLGTSNFKVIMVDYGFQGSFCYAQTEDGRTYPLNALEIVSWMNGQSIRYLETTLVICAVGFIIVLLITVYLTPYSQIISERNKKDDKYLTTLMTSIPSFLSPFIKSSSNHSWNR